MSLGPRVPRPDTPRQGTRLASVNSEAVYGNLDDSVGHVSGVSGPLLSTNPGVELNVCSEYTISPSRVPLAPLESPQALLSDCGGSLRVDCNRIVLERLHAARAAARRLRLQLEMQLYSYEVAHVYIRQFIREVEATIKYADFVRPRLEQHMSLFADSDGNVIPSTPEAIEKAARKHQYPLYRKKYDWNITIWNDGDRKKLFEIVNAAIRHDTVKLIVERRLLNHEIPHSSVTYELRSTRDTLEYSVKAAVEADGANACLTWFNLLHQELEKKVARMILALAVQQRPPQLPSGNDPEGDSGTGALAHAAEEELVYIPMGDHNATQSCTDYKSTELRRRILSNYWKAFWDSVAAALNSKADWSGKDCRLQWEHLESPAVNRAAFSVPEAATLKRLAQQFFKRNWVKIATQLNTGRTAYQCFEKYQRSFNDSFCRGDWTPEEDALLLAAVEECGQELSGPSRWIRISLRLPGRSNFQCRARYLHSLKIKLRHGNWSWKEDLWLELLVLSYGLSNWLKISRHLPHRTDMKCRERYMNVLRFAGLILPGLENEIAVALSYGILNMVPLEALKGLPM